MVFFLRVNGCNIGIEDIGMQAYNKPKCIGDIENILELFNKTKVCQGSGSTEKYLNNNNLKNHMEHGDITGVQLY